MDVLLFAGIWMSIMLIILVMVSPRLLEEFMREIDLDLDIEDKAIYVDLNEDEYEIY